MKGSLDSRPPASGAERGGRGQALFWACASLALLAALAFWLYSGPEKREAMMDQAADRINDLASGTPLSGIGDVLRKSPPPLPPEIINPPTERGTLSGRQVTGTIASPIDSGAPHEGSGRPDLSELAQGALSALAPASEPAGREAPVFSSEPLPPALEDSRVRPAHLSDLAWWLSGRYRKSRAGGVLELSPQNLNNLLGVSVAGKMPGGRGGLLRYAFHPSMLDGLYKIYIDQFMADLDQAAVKRGFNAKENQDFHKAIAGKAAAYASAMTGILQVPDLSERLSRIDSLGQKSVEENSRLAGAVFELDELKDKKASGTQIKAARMRMEGITARYRRALADHEAAQRALAERIRKEAGPALDEESLLFMAAWVQRRLGNDERARQALQTSADLMRDLARRCQEAAAE